jgi:hypothetical protein
MSTDSRETAETSAAEAPATSGWDPFTVWRERVHKPRSKSAATQSHVNADAPLVLLNPIKQSS